jgi:hypothetical protein
LSDWSYGPVGRLHSVKDSAGMGPATDRWLQRFAKSA